MPCVEFRRKTILLTHQYLSFNWPVVTLIQGFFTFSCSPDWSWEKTEPRQLTQIKLDRVGWWGTAMLREWLGIDVWLSNCTVLFFFFFIHIYIYIFSPSFSVLLNCLYLVLQILFLFPIFSPIPQRVRESANDCVMLSFLLG